MCLIKTKFDVDYPTRVKTVYNMLKNKYNYTARITRLYEMIKYVLSIDEYQNIDERTIQNGTFEAYLIDSCIDWNNGKEINFEEIYKAMLINGDFSIDEKLLFKNNNIEEIIWAIFLLITNPNLNLN